MKHRLVNDVCHHPHWRIVLLQMIIKNQKYPMSRMDPSIAVPPTNMPQPLVLNPVLMARTIVLRVCPATRTHRANRNSPSIVDCHGIMPHRVVNCPVHRVVMTSVPPEHIVMDILPVIRPIHSCAELPLRRRVRRAICRVRVGRVLIVRRI